MNSQTEPTFVLIHQTFVFVCINYIVVVMLQSSFTFNHQTLQCQEHWTFNSSQKNCSFSEALYYQIIILYFDMDRNIAVVVFQVYRKHSL